MGRKGDVIAFAVLLAVIIIGILVLHLPTFVPLMVCTGIVTLYAVLVLGKNGPDIFKAILRSALGSPWALLLAIGALIASWVQCGAVPFMVSFGLRLIRVQFFLPLVLVICAAMSAVTGSSWLTCGTLGIAFMGMASSLKIPGGMALGAVLCGAFFGDKLSRLSDFAVSTVSISQADFSRHLHLMLFTAVPSLLVSLVIFFLTGRSYASDAADFSSVNEIVTSLGENFSLSAMTLIPLGVLVAAMLLKLPGILPLVLSTFSAVIVSLVLQNSSLVSVFETLFTGFHMESGNGLVDTICNRGGMLSMVKTVLLVVFAFSMGAVLKKTDIMATAAGPVTKLIRGRVSLYICTYIISAAMAFTTGSGSIGVIVSYNVLSSFYDRLGLGHALFTRTICEMITIQQPTVVWGSSGAFVALCFGISAGAYLPYYFTAFLMPVFGIISVASEVGIGKRKGTDR